MDQIKKFLEKLKEFWAGLADKTKKAFKVAGILIAVIAVVVAVSLAVSGNSYKVLFPGMDDSETSQVYATLLEMGVQPQIDNQGNVRVPASEWDDLQYQLSAQGYPKTTLAYDTFSSMTGFTTTEFEKRVALTYQLQDRIQSTLKRWDGIADAAVIINIPEDSNYVWNQNENYSTASVNVTMRSGYSLTPQQVSAIKNHVSSSVPKLDAQAVVVIDTATGVEPAGLDGSGTFSTARLEFERELEKALEDSVKRLLTPKYGASGVTAVAKVVVDYDKILTEKKEVLPQENGSGVVEHKEEHYQTGGDSPAGGIAGEEDNTDVPTYPNLEGLDADDITIFDRVTDYDIGYILTQIEKGEPYLKSASIAVIVNDDNFDRTTEVLLADLISKSVGIETDNIKVANMDFETVQTDAPPAEPVDWWTEMRQIVIYAAIGLVLLVLILVVVLVLVRRSKKKKRHQEQLEQEQRDIQMRRNLEKEISEHKRALREEAQASANPKEDAITQEVREFAQNNPEVTANLIRSLMKEDR